MKSDVNADSLPPAAERRCVKMGIAVALGQTVEHNWPAIEQFWYQWHDSLEDFAKFLQIPLRSIQTEARKNKRFSAEQREAVRAMVNRGYRNEVLRLVGVQRCGNPVTTGDRLSEVLSDLQDISQLGISYARTRFAKIKGNELSANPNLKPEEVARLMRIAESAANTLRVVFLIDSAAKNQKDRKRQTVNPVPKPALPEPSSNTANPEKAA